MKIALDDAGRWDAVKSALGSWPKTLQLVLILTMPGAAVALIVCLR